MQLCALLSSSKNEDETSNTDAPRSHIPHETIIPGSMPHQYGSLGEGLPEHPHHKSLEQQTAAPWQAAHNRDVQRVTLTAMIYELVHEITATIEDIVPWFLSNMPFAYFQQVPFNYRMDHIKAIAAVKDANMDMYLNLKSHTPDGRTVLTFIRPGTAPGTLLKMVEELPGKYDLENPLSRLMVFSTKDHKMSLNMFVFGHSKHTLDAQPPNVEKLAQPILEYAQRIQQNGRTNPNELLQPSPLFEREALLEYISQCRSTYVQVGARYPHRFLTQRRLFDMVSHTEGTAVHVQPATDEDAGRYWLDLAVANSMPQVALENLCLLLYHHKFDVTRARLDVVPDGDNGSVTILRTLIAPTQGAAVSEEAWETLSRELKRAKWLDPETIQLVFEEYPWLGIARGEILTAMSALIHPVLAKENALAYSKANILDKITKERFIGHTAAIADLFLDRFRPENPLSDADFDQRQAEIRLAIETNVEDTVATEILFKMMDIVRHTMKTNVFMPDRYALGFRLDPVVMVAAGEEDQVLPYGVVFVHGRRFNGFHVRFRDISRGGMRLVTPASSELHALESSRQYDECYGLAFAQQLKNKDMYVLCREKDDPRC